MKAISWQQRLRSVLRLLAPEWRTLGALFALILDDIPFHRAFRHAERRLRREEFLVLPDFHLPVVVVVSPGSHGAVARFTRRLRVPIYMAVVRLGLEQVRGDGITYSVIVPEFVAPLDGPSAERFAALHRQLATFAS